MTDLRIEQADSEAALRDWQFAHNTVIPTAPLSLDDVRERAGRNRLDVMYRDGELVGCATVRPPADASAAATVIARILPVHRGQGLGNELYAHALAHARALGATVIETCVLASNEDGLRFAAARGFTEVERYVLPGDTVPFVDLRLVL
ncbi:GNAT family N-acetyltransferase [Streptomyces sp. NBC_00239]|uniref:GNAT family N-acetyltransferase n=1 Tax=Streptomyces sp. NBC_00239 TaxID=2903640 RepID=UPI002E2C093B|nr:GNAT family N-acetyltransferase [Streptomyces sp. NBC_00239]